METKRVFTAIALSLAILLGYQYFFVPAPPPPDQVLQTSPDQQTPPAGTPGRLPADQADRPAPSGTPPALTGPQAVAPPETEREGREIPVETDLYSAVISETGGGLKSFKLKNYREAPVEHAALKELVKTEAPGELPLYFTWGVEPDKTWVPLFEADQKAVVLNGRNQQASLVLKSKLPSGLEITKSFTFREQDYRMQLVVDVHNTSAQPLQGAPYLSLTNRPFSDETDTRFLFNGPAVFLDGALQEIGMDDLEDGAMLLNGKLTWAGFEGPYFMLAALPEENEQHTVRLSLRENSKVSTVVSEGAALIPPQGHIQYAYTVYFGPKKLSLLRDLDRNLGEIVNFGWLDVLAKPMLYLLNFFNKYVHNYGVAIILVTILIKLLFWPITAKGMKSMKSMQKLQPKITKLREKYQDDKERLNQEMIKLYQTHKINPVGGCLPMVLQIPVFFALYKVLLQTIELRHAPFMLWINDLSAPDRLYLGFEIPYLGGLPVLTLLMGASMFLQQKMTPTSADPTQARVMLFLPVIFTFMFLNFASGLVLYWLINNLLSIAQQYVINRQMAAEG